MPIGDNPVLLEVASRSLQYIGRSIATPTPFAIRRGATHIIVGENGSGKSTLARILESGWNIGLNRIVGDRRQLAIRSIEFADIHSLTGCADSYYQQRFEATMSDGIPTIREIIGDKFPPGRWNELCQKLSISGILDKRVNCLSSGELRKFLIINLFAETPDILIVDNPYIGLDTASRGLLNTLLADIAAQGTAVVLLVCNTADIPPFAHYLLPMKRMEVLPMMPATPGNIASLDAIFETKGDLSLMPDVALREPIDFETAFALRHCDVKYGSTVILRDVSWTVRAGERWALLGANGSGKSTLLSLVYADNPQGYRNDITIFDRRRGTGESIWEIKRRIGYISPEMHLYFGGGATALAVVASGLHDNLGCFRRIDEAMRSLTMQWLEALGIAHLAGRTMSTLSSGEQRLALIARTLIKNAPLLILDEPLHGLDERQKSLVAAMIAQILSQQGRTLVYVTHYEHEIPSLVTRIYRL